MKKFISVLLICSLMFSIFSVSAYADDYATSLISGLAAGLEEIYEGSVIVRITGRAGASTVDGAKGVVFEQMFTDKLNLKYIFSGKHAQLSKNSIDVLKDIEVTDNFGETIQLIQCKDGTSTKQIDNVIKAITGGKYDGAEVYGTTELSKKCNAKLPGSLSVKDSGISTEKTSKISNLKINGITHTAISTKALKGAAGSLMVTSVISIAESIYTKKDIYDTVAKVITDDAISVTSVYCGLLASGEIAKLATAFGVSTGAAAIGYGVLSILVPASAGYCLYILADEANLESKISTYAKSLGVKAEDLYSDVCNYFYEFDLSSKTATVRYSISAVIDESIENITKLYKGTSVWLTSAYASCIDKCQNLGNH